MGILGGVFIIGTLFSPWRRNQAIQVFCTYYSDEELNFYFSSHYYLSKAFNPHH
jgi:hypothetical protein